MKNFTTTTLIFLSVFFVQASLAQEYTKLVYPWCNEGANFGTSVAISGDFAIVGCPYYNDSIQYPPTEIKWAGTTFIYKNDDSNWNLEEHFNYAVDSSFYGYAVDIEGGIAIASRPWASVWMEDKERVGEVRVFMYAPAFNLESVYGDTWFEADVVKPDDPREDQRFGISCALSGDYMIVGSFFDSIVGKRSGSAYIYKRDSLEWVQMQKLVPDDGEAGDWFGVEVAIHGDLAAVGARKADNLSGENNGATYLYKMVDGEWYFAKKLSFGERPEVCAISDNYIAFGAYMSDIYDSVNAGSVLVANNIFDGVAAFLNGEVDANDQFGKSLAIDNSILAVGAPNDNDSGSVSLFNISDSAFVKKLKGCGNTGDQFGYDVDISGDYVIVGARYDDEVASNAGAAYIFDISDFLPENTFAGGTGSEDDPYQISTPAQLDSVRNYLNSSFIIINDIDLDIAPYNTGDGWEPIGDRYTAFTGNFNGHGFTVSNLYVNREENYSVGLFGYIVSSSIDSLSLINSSVQGDKHVGILAGYTSLSTISNCSVIGEVTGLNYHIGGMIGKSEATEIFNCSAAIEVTGNMYIGGLVGKNTNGSTLTNCYTTGKITGNSSDIGGLVGINKICSQIKDCHSSGAVYGENSVGGLIGRNDSSAISYCYTTGKATASGYVVGGFIGCNTKGSILISCYASGDVYCAFNRAGGLVGDNSSRSIILNCYSTGQVVGSNRIGGLIGWNSESSTISACFSTGEVSGDPNESNIGSLLGYNSSSTLINTFFNKETSGHEEGIGFGTNDYPVTGLTTVEMKQQNIFSEFNFDTAWIIREDSTYPALQKVDDAPFAYADILWAYSLSGISLQQLLNNDFDYETLQNNLVAKVISIDTGYVENYRIYFDEDASIGDTIRVGYRVGEVLNSAVDTLWGNRASCLLILQSDQNNAPVLTAVTDTSTKEAIPVTLTISNVTASDADGDILALVVYEGANYTLSGATVTPSSGFTGTLTVPVAVTDAVDTSNTMDININVTVQGGNNAPVLTDVINTTIQEEIPLILTMAYVTASDADDDALSLVVYEGTNYTLSGTTVTPFAGYTGTLTVPVAVTDAVDTSNVMDLIIFVVNEGSLITENQDNMLIDIFPNPVSGMVTIRCYDNSNMLTAIEMLSISGRIIKTVDNLNLLEYSLPVYGIPEGIYILRVNTTCDRYLKLFTVAN